MSFKKKKGRKHVTIEGESRHSKSTERGSNYTEIPPTENVKVSTRFADAHREGKYIYIYSQNLFHS